MNIDNIKPRSIIHHPRVIFAYNFLGNYIAGTSVNGGSYNAAAAVHDAVFPYKALPARFYVKFNSLRSVRPKLSAEILPHGMHNKLIYPVGIVTKTVIKVVVHY